MKQPLAVMLVAGWLLGWSAHPRAAVAQSDDYALAGRAWNGLAQLLAAAAETGVEVRSPARLELSALSARDGLLLIYPVAPPPRADLAAFMAEGGRLAIADDFGAGASLLEAFRIERSALPRSLDAPRLRGNRNLLIAAPRVRHPLAQDVLALVTNHPQLLRHDELQAIFGLGEQAGAIVLAGAVGRGRLVAIGDSSMLINNMLEFHGNRAFAKNLVRYLAQDGRLWIAAPHSELTGRYGGASAGDPLAGLRAGLQRLAQARLPTAAVQASSIVIALLLLLGAATALPRRSSLLRAVSLPAAETIAGFAGRVSFFSAPGRDLHAPLVAYKFELERQLAEVLGLPTPLEPLQVEAALHAAGHAEPLVLATRALLHELAAQALPAPPELPRRKFSTLVSAGERILAALQARAGGSH